ncbi:hypothetical protein G7Z17_g7740 [Cylindrodendrum hubeiense]|uniref:Uncharacterized protein n=1 Tax=Cylindrodendrum hubeiense TaxID=595255 RepID=A0A9P5H524_9HYPO|nr:hypothetical protein G7Z17_g7740 [Cylindrodendrum hubeiense]
MDNISMETTPLYDVSNPILQVDWSWKKWKALITEKGRPTNPLYVVDYKSMSTPTLIFTSPSTNDVIGTGTLHPISINARYEIHGAKGKLKALKRFETEYTHLSHAYSDDERPVAMRWITVGGGFQSWDFICLDEQNMPVAKFSASIWAVSKMGYIEFIGPKATSQAARDEIVVVSLTLFNCMLLRVSSMLSLFGAFIARPGPLDKEAVYPSHELQPIRYTDNSDPSRIKQD